MVTTSEHIKLTPSVCGDWTLHEYPVVTSTNLMAAKLPAWSAIRADTQTRGRGRFQRHWISDRGGLWLSAVVPISDGVVTRRALPLAAGLAVCHGLQELEVKSARLRWPNDVMLNQRKLAGLLIDQFKPGLAVVGMGMNVNNQPQACEPSLINQVARLAEVMPNTPKLDILTDVFLRHLRLVLTALDREGAASLFLKINELWGPARPVELDLDGNLRRGIVHRRRPTRTT